MAVKLVKVGVAAIPGVADVAEDYYDVEPKYIHLTRGAEFGVGLIGSLMVRPGSKWEDPFEALMLASEPLLIKSAYTLVSGAVAGREVTKEAIELKLRGRPAGQLRPEQLRPQLR